MSTKTTQAHYKPVSVFSSADKDGVQQFTENDLLFRICVLLAVQHYSTWLSAPTGAMITRYVTGALADGYRERWVRLSPATRLRYGLLDNPNSKQGHDKQTLRVADIMLKSGWQRKWVWDSKKDTAKQRAWLSVQHPTIRDMISGYYKPTSTATETAESHIVLGGDTDTGFATLPMGGLGGESVTEQAQHDLVRDVTDGSMVLRNGAISEPNDGKFTVADAESKATTDSVSTGVGKYVPMELTAETYRARIARAQRNDRRVAITALIIFIVGVISVVSYLIQHY